MRTFGLIGKTLTHSFSKTFFENKFAKEAIVGVEYQLFELNVITDFEFLLATQPNLVGLNVTIPYKQTIIPFLDELSTAAQAIGAVNCVQITKSKKIGHNTDAFGFEYSLNAHLPLTSIAGNYCVFVFGTGGSSKAVQYILQQHNINFMLVSREAKIGSSIAYSQVAQYLGERNLYINCTPLGMYPNVETCPQIDFTKVTKGDVFYDLVYNPEETLLLQQAKQKGAVTINGLPMLHLQAEESWRIWNRG